MQLKKKNDQDHAKYITTQEVNKLTSDNFTARLQQAKFSYQKLYC